MVLHSVLKYILEIGFENKIFLFDNLLDLWNSSGSDGVVLICFTRDSFNTSTSIGHRGSAE